MANQRPIRRPPTPRWKRGRRRPVRWLDANSTRAEAGLCNQVVWDLFCEPSAPIAILLDGDADWDWADRSNVRIDRILGTISWDANAARITTGVSTGIPAYLDVRLGILAVEDGLPETIDLFDPENLEEYEWMWLYHSMGRTQRGYQPVGEEVLHWMDQSDNIPIDIRTRRSLGKKDKVVLYGQYKRHSFTDSDGAGTVTGLPRVTSQLRSILRS